MGVFMNTVSGTVLGGIPGVEVFRLPAWNDERGWFREVFRSTWVPVDFSRVQLNLSLTRAGALRGLHFHREQWDWWIPAAGSLLAAVADLREDSPAFLRTAVTEMHADQGHCLLLPPGVAHGFLALSEVRLLYAVNRFYDGSDEQGVAWDDPVLGIPWGCPRPVLSERDRNNPPVADLFPGRELRSRS